MVVVEAGVDEELAELGHLLAVLGRRDVDRLATGVHHRLEVAVGGADQHPPRKEVARIEPAGGIDSRERMVAVERRTGLISQRDVAVVETGPAHQREAGRHGEEIGGVDAGVPHPGPQPHRRLRERLARRVQVEPELVVLPHQRVIDEHDHGRRVTATPPGKPGAAAR